MMILTRDLTKSYLAPAGPHHALRGVNLAVEAGEFVALVGKSGSGKSTLLNLVGGLDRPTSGGVLVGGASIPRMSENELAKWRGRHVGLVFQFFQLLPTLTVAENVMLPMDFSDAVPPAERRGRALGLLDRVGVADQADKLPAALSGGQQQRVAIARALANRPPLVLADEPTGTLDSAAARDVLGLFRQLADGGTTVLIASHERDLASVVDRVVEIADGTVRP